MLGEMTQFVLETVGAWGYWGIFIMMAIESSFVPFPSEVVLIPAGYLVQQGEMNLVWVMLAAFMGSMVGAWVNYLLAMSLGRKFLYRYGHYFLMPPHTLDKLERFFKTHGAVSTFTGRLIPGIRQLISIPAGFSRMNWAVFSLYTFLGAGLWSVLLIGLGYLLGDNQEAIAAYTKELVWGAIAFVAVVLATYYYWHKKRKNMTDNH